MNAKVYSLLLTVCRADLRREFGAEMMQVFLDDLEDHRRRFGFCGAARVWQRSLTDLCDAALREVVARHQFVAPMIAYGLMQLWAGFIVLVTTELLSPQLISISSMEGLILAAVTFLVVRVAEGSVLEPLKLESR